MILFKFIRDSSGNKFSMTKGTSPEIWSERRVDFNLPQSLAVQKLYKNKGRLKSTLHSATSLFSCAPVQNSSASLNVKLFDIFISFCVKLTV